MACFEIKTDAVSNADMIKIDEFILSVNIPSSHAVDKRHFNISAIANTTATLTIIGDGYFTDSAGTANLGKTLTCTGTTLGSLDVYLSTGTYYLKISGKYNIKYLSAMDLSNRLSLYEGTLFSDYMTECYFYGFSGVGFPVKISDFSTKRLTRIIVTGKGKGSVVGDLAKFSGNTAMQTIDFRTTGVSGNIATLSDCSNLQLLRLDSSNVNGDIQDLSSCTKLTQLAVNGLSGFSGTLESLLDGLFANGRVSGSIAVAAGLSGVSYNGELIVSTAYKNFNFNSSGWTPA